MMASVFFFSFLSAKDKLVLHLFTSPLVLEYVWTI